MHIAFDGRSFFSGGTGDRTYFRELIGEMSRLAPENRYTLYYREPDADREAFAHAYSNVHTAAVWHRVGWLWGQCAVAPRLRRDGVDLYHAQYLLPPFSPRPTVVTIHDITFHLFPHWNPPRTRRIMNILIPLAARTGGARGHVYHVAFRVEPDDLDDYSARLQSLGLEVRGPVNFSTGRRSYFVEDPDEHYIELTDR